MHKTTKNRTDMGTSQEHRQRSRQRPLWFFDASNKQTGSS